MIIDSAGGSASDRMAFKVYALQRLHAVNFRGDRQRLKQLDVALQTMAAQATQKLRLAAEKFGKALAWFERGATAGKLTMTRR